MSSPASGNHAYDIAVTRVSGDSPNVEAFLQSAIETTLRRHRTLDATGEGVSRAEISVVLVDDARIADLNRHYLGHDGPTDVLAFDLRDGGRDGKRDRRTAPVEGEIIISAETAAREAHARGHEMDAELALYAVHGTLHLLGYNDGKEQEAARMHALEDRILMEMGVQAVYRTATG